MKFKQSITQTYSLKKWPYSIVLVKLTLLSLDSETKDDFIDWNYRFRQILNGNWWPKIYQLTYEQSCIIWTELADSEPALTQQDNTEISLTASGEVQAFFKVDIKKTIKRGCYYCCSWLKAFMSNTLNENYVLCCVFKYMNLQLD